MSQAFWNKTQTILVVDDTDSVLRVVVAILKAANFVVLHAASGPNAVKLAAAYEGKIELLLSDVNMPELSGPDLGGILKGGATGYASDVHVRVECREPIGAQLQLGVHSETICRAPVASNG